MSTVLYEVKGNIAILTISREKALNALNSEVLNDLDAALDAVDVNAVRALILTGAGKKSFVAGADIGEMSTLTPEEGEAFGKKGNDVFRKIETFPIPVIAAVNGFALGGGNEICMSCDIRICSDNAIFGQPEAGLGITPGFGGTQRLARIIAPGLAKEIIYSTKNIDAAKAKEVGLVNEVYTQDEYFQQLKSLLLRLLRMHLSLFVLVRKLSTKVLIFLWTKLSYLKRNCSAAASRHMTRSKVWMHSLQNVKRKTSSTLNLLST